MKAKKIYVDLNRKYESIVTDWNECLRIQKEIGGVNFKSFTSQEEAERYLQGTTQRMPTGNNQKKILVKGTEIKLLQGLARYEKSPKADQKEYILKKIEKYKVEGINDFTLSIPQKENMIAVCRRIENATGLKKIAEISEQENETILEYFVNTSELEVSQNALGYLEINLFGYQLYYEFSVKAVPDYSDYDGIIAFVDGSGGGNDVIEYEGVDYKPYGGAYLFYKNGEKIPFVKSTDEPDPVSDGLKGISKNVGNVYGELNAAIKAVCRAEQLGIKKIRIYYDCEQIGGNAPGGVNKKADTKITQKYADFWKEQEFHNLEYIEFIHVDAHTKFDLNNAVDLVAKAARDIVACEFEEDEKKREAYVSHRNDYVKEN